MTSTFFWTWGGGIYPLEDMAEATAYNTYAIAFTLGTLAFLVTGGVGIHELDFDLREVPGLMQLWPTTGSKLQWPFGQPLHGQQPGEIVHSFRRVLDDQLGPPVHVP